MPDTDIPCRSQDPDMWFSYSPRAIATAAELCMRCPLQRQCADVAIATGERHGVWGGTTEEERRALRRPAVRAGAAA